MRRIEYLSRNIKHSVSIEEQMKEAQRCGIIKSYTLTTLTAMNARRDADLCLWCDQIWYAGHLRSCSFAPDHNCMFTCGEDFEVFAFVKVSKEGFKPMLLEKSEDVVITCANKLSDEMCDPKSHVSTDFASVSSAHQMFDGMSEPTLSSSDDTDSQLSIVDHLQDVIDSAHKVSGEMHVPDFMLEMARVSTVTRENDEVTDAHKLFGEMSKPILEEAQVVEVDYGAIQTYSTVVSSQVSTQNDAEITFAKQIEHSNVFHGTLLNDKVTHVCECNEVETEVTSFKENFDLVNEISNAFECQSECISTLLPTDIDHKMVSLSSCITTSNELVSYYTNTIIWVIAFGGDTNENWVMSRNKLFDPGKGSIAIKKEAWDYAWYILANFHYHNVMWNIWPATTICFDWIWGILYLVRGVYIPHHDEFDSSSAYRGSSCTLTLEDKGDFRGEEDMIYVGYTWKSYGVVVPSRHCIFGWRNNRAVVINYVFDPGWFYGLCDLEPSFETISTTSMQVVCTENMFDELSKPMLSVNNMVLGTQDDNGSKYGTGDILVAIDNDFEQTFDCGFIEKEQGPNLHQMINGNHNLDFIKDCNEEFVAPIENIASDPFVESDYEPETHIVCEEHNEFFELRRQMAVKLSGLDNSNFWKLVMVCAGIERFSTLRSTLLDGYQTFECEYKPTFCISYEEYNSSLSYTTPQVKQVCKYFGDDNNFTLCKLGLICKFCGTRVLKPVICSVTLEDKGDFRGEEGDIYMRDTWELIIDEVSCHNCLLSRIDKSMAILTYAFDPGGLTCDGCEAMIMWPDFVYSRTNLSAFRDSSYDWGGECHEMEVQMKVFDPGLVLLNKSRLLRRYYGFEDQHLMSNVFCVGKYFQVFDPGGSGDFFKGDTSWFRHELGRLKGGSESNLLVYQCCLSASAASCYHYASNSVFSGFSSTPACLCHFIPMAFMCSIFCF